MFETIGGGVDRKRRPAETQSVGGEDFADGAVRFPDRGVGVGAGGGVRAGDGDPAERLAGGDDRAVVPGAGGSGRPG